MKHNLTYSCHAGNWATTWCGFHPFLLIVETVNTLRMNLSQFKALLVLKLATCRAQKKGDWWEPVSGPDFFCGFVQQYAKLTALSKDITSRLWGKLRQILYFIPRSLEVIFIASSWILIYRNWDRLAASSEIYLDSCQYCDLFSQAISATTATFGTWARGFFWSGGDLEVREGASAPL